MTYFLTDEKNTIFAVYQHELNIFNNFDMHRRQLQEISTLSVCTRVLERPTVEKLDFVHLHCNLRLTPAKFSLVSELPPNYIDCKVFHLL